MKLLSWKSVLALAGALLLIPAAFAATSSTHTWKRVLKIRGGLPQPLFPGASQQLDLALTNRAGAPLIVRRLRIRVRLDRAHRRAGCSVKRDFFVRQLPRRAFPIRLSGKRSRRSGRPRGRTRTLTALGVRTLPQVGMRDRPYTNQDACKGARLRFRYKATARTAGRKR
jgi:hypothetical protein